MATVRSANPTKTREAVAALAEWLRDGTAAQPERSVLAEAVRLTARTLAGVAPGRSVEVRVPPFVAVQCISGPTHTRGNPPNVVETDPRTWLLLATGLQTVEEAAGAGTLSLSGSRATEVAEWLPVVRLPHPGPALHRPIAVFDAGIGSYSAVAKVHQTFPGQDIIYLADRAAFPYGAKTIDELRRIVGETIGYLSGLGAAAVIVASNVPSVTVLADLVDDYEIPIFDVLPPIAEALRIADGTRPVILGVQTLVESKELTDHIARVAGDAADRVVARNASALVELVESGLFLTDVDDTQRRVSAFMADLRSDIPELRVVTLSSTHLPWLRDFFERAAPELSYLDPINDVVNGVRSHTSEGSGTIVGLVSESADYPSAQFLQMASTLGVDLPFTVIGDIHA